MSEATVEFDKLDHVPAWLSDLAVAVTGVPLCDDEEEVPLTLERIRANTSPQDIRGQYIHVWRRFFGELPSGQKAKAPLSSTAPASKPPAQTPAARSGEPREETSKPSNPATTRRLPRFELAGTYRFEGRMFSFAGNNFSEGVIDIADDDGDQTVLRKVVARGRVIWRGLIRGGQFDGEVVEIMRARNEPTGIVYTTFLGENDHYNSNGVRLNSVADILRQDRANYHSGLGDQREEDDGGIFATKQGLSKFGNYSIVLDRLTPSDILRGRYGSVVVQVIGQKIYVEGVE